MTPNDKLTEETIKIINDRAEAYVNKYLNGKVNTREFSLLEDGYIAGATAWAPWKVKYDELQAEFIDLGKRYNTAQATMTDQARQYQVLKDQFQRMANALESIANAPVPTNEREMISWVETARNLAQQLKDGTKGKEVGEEPKPEGWPWVCEFCGKQDCGSDHK